MRRAVLFALLVLAAPAAAQDKPRFPPGKSTPTLGGLSCHLELPERFDPAKEYSLLVALHGMRATAASIASWFEPLVPAGFVVLAPQARGPVWSKPDVESVKAAIAEVAAAVRIGRGRLHAAGFSNGGAHLAFLAFDDEPAFATACFMGSGFGGGKVAERAKEGMAVVALCGALDPALPAVEMTPKRLAGEVRRVDFLTQPGLGHEIPDALMPFYYHWVKAMEGRFFPGDDTSFPWIDDLLAARERLQDKPDAAFVYLFDEKDKDDADAKAVQNEVFLDPLVQHYGRRLVAVKIDRDLEPDLLDALGVKTTPAVVVLKAGLDPAGITARFEGKTDAKALSDALRAVCADKSPPRR